MEHSRPLNPRLVLLNSLKIPLTHSAVGALLALMIDHFFQGMFWLAFQGRLLDEVDHRPIIFVFEFPL